MPRPRMPDGHRIHVNVMLSEREAAAIDAARGNLERGPWIRQAALEAASRDASTDRPTSPVTQARIDELRALALASDVKPVSDPAELSRLGIEAHAAEVAAQSQPAPCLHPSGEVEGGYCKACKQDID